MSLLNAKLVFTQVSNFRLNGFSVNKCLTCSEDYITVKARAFRVLKKKSNVVSVAPAIDKYR